MPGIKPARRRASLSMGARPAGAPCLSPRGTRGGRRASKSGPGARPCSRSVSTARRPTAVRSSRPKGLDLYIASTRPGAVGGPTDLNDIWVVRRDSVDSPWGVAEHLPAPVNSAAADFCPTPLNGKRLYFVSARGGAGSCGAGDMYRTRNNPAHGWDAPENLGCNATGEGPNFAGGEFSPSIVETDEGTLLFFSSTGLDGLDQDIYVSVMRADGTFGPGTQVAELSTAVNDQMPNVSRNGLEIVFGSRSDRRGRCNGRLHVVALQHDGRVVRAGQRRRERQHRGIRDACLAFRRRPPAPFRTVRRHLGEHPQRRQPRRLTDRQGRAGSRSAGRPPGNSGDVGTKIESPRRSGHQ